METNDFYKRPPTAELDELEKSGLDTFLLELKENRDEFLDSVNIQKFIDVGALPVPASTIQIPDDKDILDELDAGISVRGWSNTITFSATDYNTVQWTSGSIILSNGDSYGVDAGNTGTMTAQTYIYFEKDNGDLEFTTTSSDSVGKDKILIAVAQNNSDTASDAIFQAFGGRGGVLIKADNIASNTITANELSANSVTATEINVSTLDAISANMGTITAGTIDASTATINNINADKITAGTISGRTLIANGGSGTDVVINNNGTIYYRYGSNNKAYMYCNSSGDLIIDADNLIYLIADGSGDDIVLEAGDDILFDASDRIYTTGHYTYTDLTGDSTTLCDNHVIYYNEDQDGDSALWHEGGSNKMQLDDGGDLYVAGDVSADNIDYAEYFESSNGKKIPVGSSVVFDIDDKIRIAKEGEEPIGAVSGTASITLNSPLEWGGKFLRNDYGEYIYEEVTFWRTQIEEEIIKKTGQKVKRKKNISGIIEDGEKPPKGVDTKKIKRKKISAEYDKTKKFIKRKERDEWLPIGLLGRVRITKGQQIGKNWVKIRDISSTIEEWLVK